MTHFIGIIIFFSIVKKLSRKFTSVKQIIPYLIGALIIINLPLARFFPSRELYNVLEGFLNMVIIMSVIKIITLKINEKRSVLKKEKNRSGDKDEKKLSVSPWDSLNEVFNTPREEKKELIDKEITPAPMIENTDVSLLESKDSFDREIARLAVVKHLERRGFKTSPDSKTKFDLIVKNYQKQDYFVKFLAYTLDSDNLKIVLSSELFGDAQDLARSFMLFVVTETRKDEDNDYLGNYVKIYKLDSRIEDAGFEFVNDSYEITLAKFRKNASDWETRIKN